MTDATNNTQALQNLLMALADDEFILGYRNSEWTGIAPMLEEDVAFSSMSQDEIGHARILYEMLAQLTGVPADKLAYAREPGEFRNCRLVEHRRLDWAYAIARHYLYDTADHIRMDALSQSRFTPLANAAQKIVREEKYHLMHGDMWIKRLVGMSSESSGRLEDVLTELWPDALGIFEPLQGEEQLVSEGILPRSMQELQGDWLEQLAMHFDQLELPFPVRKNRDTGRYEPTVEPSYGGRVGQHTEEFASLWEEMTSVYRLDPEAVW